MKNSYPKTAGPVKATYTIRYGGTTLRSRLERSDITDAAYPLRVLRVRVIHLELLKLLCLLFRSREAA